jgi:hypothetical protein
MNLLSEMMNRSDLIGPPAAYACIGRQLLGTFYIFPFTQGLRLRVKSTDLVSNEVRLPTHA